MLNFLYKLSLTYLFMCFHVLVFLQNMFYGFKDKNYDIFCFMNIGPMSICNKLKCVLKYHVFVFKQVLGKIRFPIEKIKFDKILVLFLIKFARHKNDLIC